MTPTPSKTAALAVVSFTFAALLAGCTNLPGKPAPNSIPIQPNDVVDFKALYAQNCQGCHGVDGKNGTAVSLSDPLYLKFANDTVIHRVTAMGVPGTAMPAFAQSAGGMLTDAQIDALVHGIETNWARADAATPAAALPPYAAPAAGNASHGLDAFRKFCGSCHGPDGKGTERASSIVDPAFLALVSDQSLRTTTIAGRADLGSPNFCADVKGECMTSQEVTDVVAWLGAQRTAYPGQPYPNAAPSAGERK